MGPGSCSLVKLKQQLCNLHSLLQPLELCYSRPKITFVVCSSIYVQLTVIRSFEYKLVQSIKVSLTTVVPQLYFEKIIAVYEYHPSIITLSPIMFGMPVI
jgi:hypothetical protein